MITSDVTSESSSVPAFNCRQPPITLTKPVADLVSLAEVVKVRTSPTSYPEPASSTMTSLTEPLVIPLTTNSALLFPKFSISTGSWSVWRIPVLVSDAEDSIASTVNETSTSLTVEFAVIVSPSWNTPSIFASSSSVTDCVPSWNVIASLTIAVAPEVCAVIFWLIISSPDTPVKPEHLRVVSVLQSPFDTRNICSVG